MSIGACALDAAALARARALVAGVPDPEIPVVTLADLGILRGVAAEGEVLRVTLTPTYSGCPATEAIVAEVRRVLADAGFGQARVELALSPPWTTDWISEDGRRRLREYGIAPPGHAAGAGGVARVHLVRRPGPAASIDATGSAGSAAGASGAVRSPTATAAAGAPDADAGIACPRCGSSRTERVSQFGSTPCKALYRCTGCGEPFDYFKPY